MSMATSEFNLYAHTVATIVTRSTLVFSGLYYGRQLQKLGNTLLAYEWYILGISACCGIVVALDQYTPVTWVWDYLDAFSRLLGVPIIATLGILRITHQVRLTKRQEGILFAVSLIAAELFFTLDFTIPIREPIYLVTMLGFGVPVMILICHTFQADRIWEAWMLIAALPLYLYITPLDHYYYLPHNDTAILLNDDAAAHVGWAFLFAAIFYAYRGIVVAESSARRRSSPATEVN